MSHRIHFFGVVLPIMISLHAGAQLPEADLVRMNQAAPSAASVVPKQPRLLLIFTRSEGFQHSAIPYAAQALEIMGRKTGAFATVRSEDLSAFLPENLKRFDAVCFDNTTQLKFEDPRIRKSLLEFIAGGKGIVGIHAATDNFPTWEEGQALWGGVFDSHPWTGDGTWAVRITDPTHPLTQSFGGKGFLLHEEIYRIRQVNLRDNCRVLLALDMRSPRNREANGVRFSDRDLPISWVRTYGKGRLFYCSLGHNEEIYWNPAILKHYLDGIQFAMGDLPAVTTPVPFDPASLFDPTALGEILQRVAAYEPGRSRAPLVDLNAFIRWVDDVPSVRKSIEQECIRVLREPATPAAKQFLCEKLYQIGSEASVGVLSGMLADPGTAAMAVYALEGIPGAAADAALLQALHDGRGGIAPVTALGRRKVEAAITSLVEIVTQPDAAMASAVVAALAAIGTPESMHALEWLSESSRPELRTDILHALVLCAERSPGDASLRLPAFKRLLEAHNPVPVRAAALRGLAMGDRAGGRELILAILQSKDTDLHPAAAKLVSAIGDTSLVRSAAAKLASMPPGTQAMVIASLEGIRDGLVEARVIEALRSTYPAVRMAAIRTLGSMGGGAAVLPLARFASRATGEEKKEARTSLATLGSPSAEESIGALLATVPAPEKIELLRAMGERGGRVTPRLLDAARDRSAAVRVEAARTLRMLGAPENVAPMVGLLVKTSDQSFRREMELAIAGAAKRISPPADEPVLEAYPAARDDAVRISLISTLGRIGAKTSLPLLRRELEGGSPALRRESIRALSLWPTAEPFADLWSLARRTKDKIDRALALRGSVRLIRLDSTRSAEELTDVYREAMRVAPDASERKLLLSALGEIRTVAAMKTAAGFSGNNELKTEAEAAMLTIAEGLPDSLRPGIIPEIRALVAGAKDSISVKRGKILLAAIAQEEDYITTWQFSGPYEGSGEALLDRPFAPEMPSGAGWLPLVQEAPQVRSGNLELDRIFKGEDVVVYLRAHVWSAGEASGRLEMRHSHGVKIWWNGTLALASANMREYGADPETAPVALQKGWNVVLMKLERGESPWRTALRLRARDGERLEGIRVSAAQN